jgi:hypothetical protein
MKKQLFSAIAAISALIVVIPMVVRGAASVPHFEVDPSFPQLPAGKLFGDMSSVTVDAQDHIWMIHRPATVPAAQRANAMPPVVEFDASGKLLRAWGGPGAGFEWPEREHGIYAGQQGVIWISGNNGYAAPNAAPPPGKSDDMLLKFTPEGKFILQIGHSGKSSGDADHDNVKQAADMVVFKNEIYVADGYGNHRVAVFDTKDGTFKRAWMAKGGPQYNIVHAIRVSNDGMVYVADRENKRVQVFTTDGTFRQEVIIGGKDVTRSAAGLAFSPDRAQQYLYVADINNAIHILDRKSLKPLDSFGKGGTAPGEFGTVHEIATDSKGNLYTAELRTHRVQKFLQK